MPVGEYFRRRVLTSTADETVLSAARRMAKEGVGSLVVLEGEEPVGIVTDRDVALQTLVQGLDAESAQIADLMGGAPVTVPDDASLAQVIERIGHQAVRRLPVTSAERLTGIVTADDLVRLLSCELAGIAAVLAAQDGAPPPTPGPVAGSGSLRCVQHYQGDVVTLRADVPVKTAAKQMHGLGIGCIVVTADADQVQGIVTDRDLALRVVAEKRDPDATPISAVMSSPVLGVDAADPLEAVIEKMRSHGVRRMPVLRQGRAVGIVTVDDLLVTLGHELGTIGRALRREVQGARRSARIEQVRGDLEAGLHDVGEQLERLGGQARDTVLREYNAFRERLRRLVG
jgi:CBS domain-containing protein